MPNGKWLVWMTGVSLLVVLGVKHYEAKKAAQ